METFVCFLSSKWLLRRRYEEYHILSSQDSSFIRQRKLDSKIDSDILQIAECGYAAWDFILFFYESGWNILTANKEKNSFRQYVSAQFRLRNTKNLEVKNKKSTNPEKKANISRIPSSIPPRLSKKVLEKSKFYKGKGKTGES